MERGTSEAGAIPAYAGMTAPASAAAPAVVFSRSSFLVPLHSFLASSSLAVAAPDGGALADAGVAQRAPAAHAGLALAAVYRQFLLEVAGRAVGADEVAQGGAAAGDGV